MIILPLITIVMSLLSIAISISTIRRNKRTRELNAQTIRALQIRGDAR